MFRRRKAAQPKGQGAGAAAAKQVSRAAARPLLAATFHALTSCFQMGLFLELGPEQVMTEGDLDDPDLEAELAALTGRAAGAGGRAKPKRKSWCTLLLLRVDLGESGIHLVYRLIEVSALMQGGYLVLHWLYKQQIPVRNVCTYLEMHSCSVDLEATGDCS